MSVIIMLTLIGCANNAQPKVVVKKELVNIKIPNELFEIPPKPKLNGIKNADVSLYIVEQDKRANHLENNLITIKNILNH